MNALQIIGLLVLIVSVAGLLAFIFQNGKDKEEEEFTFNTPEYTKEELENIKAAEKAYNKPVVAEELTTQEPEFVKPEVYSRQVSSETMERILEITPPDPEATSEAAKPAKKKRKYYPKKKKQ